MTTAVVDAVDRYLEGLNRLEPEIVLSAFSPDAVISYPGRAPMDPTVFCAYFEQVRHMLSGFRIEARERFATEHGHAARWVFEATTVSGQVGRCEGIDSWVIGPDGRIAEMDVYYDPAPLMAALGAGSAG